MTLFKKIATSRWLGLAVAVVLLATGAIETFEQFRADVDDGLSMGTHHGVLLYGLQQALRSVAELFEASTAVGERLEA